MDFTKGRSSRKKWLVDFYTVSKSHELEMLKLDLSHELCVYTYIHIELYVCINMYIYNIQRENHTYIIFLWFFVCPRSCDVLWNVTMESSEYA